VVLAYNVALTKECKYRWSPSYDFLTYFFLTFGTAKGYSFSRNYTLNSCFPELAICYWDAGQRQQMRALGQAIKPEGHATYIL
jgi:hypothetical protein